MTPYPGYKPPYQRQEKQEVAPPSEAKLKQLLIAGCADVAQGLIDQHKLRYEIVNGELKDLARGAELWLKRFITIDPETILLKERLKILSKHDDEVLIQGETGTGKELLSRSLIGDREEEKGCKSLAVNCAGLPDNLIESELFGHVKGSFTGADETKHGLMSAAGGGLLFLDEIGELPLSVQGKLLRAIQDKRIRKVGANNEEEIKCRLVFATNKNLSTAVKCGHFRQDLYARISTFEFVVKPLRDRLCDVESICNSIPHGKDFYAKYWPSLQGGNLSLEHNVRSLQKYIRRFAIFGEVS